MDENKKQRIIGLVVGFIGFVLLFFLSYEFFVFEGMFYSVIGQISIEIAQMTTRCYNCDDEAIWFWVGFGLWLTTHLHFHTLAEESGAT